MAKRGVERGYDGQPVRLDDARSLGDEVAALQKYIRIRRRDVLLQEVSWPSELSVTRLFLFAVAVRGHYAGRARKRENARTRGRDG